MAPSLVLTLLWTFLVRCLVRPVTIPRSEETLLYCCSSVVSVFLIALISGWAYGDDASARAVWILWHSLGIWFVGCILSALMGVLVLRVSRPKKEEHSEVTATSKPTMCYDHT
jgi:hypothetical protein